MDKAARIRENISDFILHNISEGFCLMQMIVDDDGQPVDFIVLEANSAFKKHSGIKNEQVIGRSVRELMPSTDLTWLKEYGTIVKAGKSARLEKHIQSMDCYFDIQIYSVNSENKAIVFFTDISDRKKKEEALRHENAGYMQEINLLEETKRALQASEEKYRMLFDSIDEAFCIVEMIFDADGKPADYRHIDINMSFEKQTGLKNAKNKTVRELIPDIEPFWIEVYGQVALSSEPIRFERRSEALGRWYDVYAFRVGDKDSRKVGILFKDIDDRKKDEEKLAFQAHMLSSVQDAIVAIDENYNVSYWNEMAEKLTGWPAQEVLGKKAPDFFQTMVIVVSWDSILSEIQTKGSYMGELEARRKDGKAFTADVHVKIQYGTQKELLGGVTSFRDVTERNKAEEALKESELKLRTILENSHDGIYMLDLQTGKYVYMSPTQMEMTGFQPEELSPEETFERIHPDDRKPVPEQNQHPMDLYQDGEYRWRIKSGQYRWLNAKHKIVCDDAGQPIALIGIWRDVTDQRKAEERTYALVNELRKGDKNKNEFLGALSHELRNPLATISAGLQLLDITDDLKQSQNAKQIMKRQIDQLCHLVDDLLDLTRITNNKIDLKKECVELTTLALLATEDQRPLFDEKGVTLETEIGKERLYLDGDPVRLRQVIGNLLHNALKFTREGGKAVLSVYMEKNKAVICVKDNGIGMKAEILQDIFEPFIQADNSLDRNNGGLGLGLSITKGIIQLHGGSVKASSEGIGKGSSFYIYLPLDQKTGKPPSYRGYGGNAARSLRILFIEDNRDFAGILSATLKLLGHEVVAAYDGVQGIKKAKEITPQVIFCDIGLPVMDGYEIARRLRSEETLKEVPLIALTGYAGERDIERAMEAGFSMHLPKPIDMARIQDILDKVS